MKNRSLLNVGNKYEYQINVSHPAIIEAWEHFKVKWENGEIDTELPIYSDRARRVEFEKAMFKSKWFQNQIKKEKPPTAMGDYT